MSEGQGFAVRVTLENLPQLAPLLKKPRAPAGGGGGDAVQDEDRADATPLDPAARAAAAMFLGVPVRVKSPFPRKTPGSGGTRSGQATVLGVAGAAAQVIDDLELVWQSKPLAHRDLTIAGPARKPGAIKKTKATGSINLDHGLLDPGVDHRHYFRETIFAGLHWGPPNAKVVHATTTFRLIVMGVDRGDFSLTLHHTTSTTSRSYVQHNAMTRLSWGTARTHVADAAHIGLTMSLFRSRSDPSRFQLSIA